MLKFVFLVCLVEFAHCSCTQDTGGTTTTDYNITDGSSDSWEFRGLDVGAISGDFYHLVSFSIGNCAVIRENANGTQVWTKQYTTGTLCSSIKVDSSENKAFFGGSGTTFHLGSLNYSDGALNSYLKMSNGTYRISDTRGGISISPDGAMVAFGGNERSSYNNGYACILVVSDTSLKCDNSTTTYFSGPAFSSDYQVLFVQTSESNQYLVFKAYSAPDLTFIYGKYTFDYGANSAIPVDYVQTSANSNHFCFAADVLAQDLVYLAVVDASDGSPIITR